MRALSSKRGYSHGFSLLLALVHPVAASAQVRVGFRGLQVRAHHLDDELLEADARLPAELAARLGGVAEERVDLGRAKVARIDRDDAPAFRVDALLRFSLAAPAHAD